MKRKIAGIMFGIAVLVAAGTFVGCGGTPLERDGDRIADYRYAVLRGEGNGFVLEMIGGVRETPYASDGEAARDKTEYTVFTLIPSESGMTEEATLEATLGGTEYSVTLAPHPFRDRLSAELSVAPSGEELSALTVEVNGEEVALNTVATDIISGDRAYELALEALADRKDVTDKGEIYLRLTENTVTGEGVYWYATFADASSRVSVLLDAVTGEVRASGG